VDAEARRVGKGRRDKEEKRKRKRKRKIMRGKKLNKL
jgi:hypothetical protein